MRALRPGVLVIGTRVLLDDATWTVTGLAGTSVLVSDETGQQTRSDGTL